MSGYNTPYARNFRLEGQSVVSRPGHQLFASLTAGSFPKGIGNYLRASTANDRLIVRHNTDATHKLYTIDTAGTATSIVTAALIASDNKMRFLNVGDVIYCMNWSDQFGKLSNVTYTQPATVPWSFAPAYATAFDGRTFASGRSTNPNTVYYSVQGNYEDFTNAWTWTLNAIEQITGLASTNQAIFYFTPDTISVTDKGDIVNTAGTITYNASYLQTKEGAVNQDGIVSVGNAVYYISYSNSINKIVRWQNVVGYDTVNLTDRVGKGISEFMKTIPAGQTDCRWYAQQDTNLIHRFFKSSGSTIYDIIVIYDYVHDLFLIDTNRFFNWWTFFKWKNYSISCIEPKVFLDEYSYDDQWSAIPFEYRTKYYYVSGGTFKNTLRESRTLLDVNDLSNITQEIRIDGYLVDTKNLLWINYASDSPWIGTTSIGTEAIGTEWSDGEDDLNEVILLRTKGQLNKKGRKIQRRRTMSTVAGRIRLKEVTPRLESLPPQATKLTV